MRKDIQERIIDLEKRVAELKKTNSADYNVILKVLQDNQKEFSKLLDEYFEYKKTEH